MKNKTLYTLIVAITLFALVFSGGTTVAAAEQGNVYNGVKLTAMTESDEAFLSNYGISLDTKAQVIVEVEGNSLSEETLLIEKYGSISELSVSAEGKALLDEIYADQNKVIEGIRKIKGLKDVEISARYSAILNGFAIETTVGNMFRIRELEGVKTAYTAQKIVAFDTEETTYIVTGEGYEPYMITSGDMISSEAAYLEGYTGKGTLTAILDTGMDYTHEAFQGQVPDAKYDVNSLNALLETTTLSCGATSGTLLYRNAKIPFTFDYADWDYDVKGTSDHGHHVAGIVGANAGEIRGVAYDTQIAMMKVFSDEGSSYSDAMIAALDDACKLGADSVNMSLGMSGGLLAANEAVAEVYNRLLALGINVIVAAGNDAYQGINDISGESLPSAANPDYGVAATPSTYIQNLSVASVNNQKQIADYIQVGDYRTMYSDSATTANLLMTTLSGQSLEYVIIGGVGDVSDYNGVNVRGKIAVVERGTLSFTDKCRNAYNAGAVAIIVYDNVYSESLINMQIDGQAIPAIFVQKKFGEIMIAEESKTVYISSGVVDLVQGGRMSNFSSWGVTSDLRLKPEITAPGGMIYSSVFNGYAAYSGTSMASPQVAGAASVIRQAIKENYPDLPLTQLNTLVNSIMMSTAQPILNTNDVYYSVRNQGAGLINLENSVKTGAYLSTENGLPKGEMGYSVEGEYSFEFYVNNMTAEALTFRVSSAVMSDIATVINGIAYYSLTSEFLGEEYALVAFEGLDGDTVTVEGGASRKIKVSIILTEEGKKHLDDAFENGTFVEGFIFLESLNDDQCDLSMPFMGFYGDWLNLDVFESFTWEDEDAHMVETSPLLLNMYTQVGYYLGMNSVSFEADESKIYYSNILGNAATLSTIIGLKRAVTEMEYTIVDENGNLVYSWKEEGTPKSFYYSSTGYTNFAISYTGWQAFDENGKPYPDGSSFMVTITATPESGGDKQSIAYNVTIDQNAPVVEDYSIERNDEGRVMLSVKARDNNYLQIAELYDSTFSWMLNEGDAIESEKGESTEILYDITGIAADLSASGIDPSKLTLRLYDYAYNYSDLKIDIGPSLLTMEKKVTIGMGGNYTLDFKAYPSSFDVSKLEWKSLNRGIVEVDDGVLTPKGFGTTKVIVESLTGLYAECEVTVSGYADTSVVITGKTSVMTIGDEFTFAAKVYPQDAANKTVRWHSSDDAILEIDENGKAYAKGVGDVTVTATSACGNTDTCQVKVNPVFAESVKTDFSSINLLMGETKTVTAVVYPKEATYRSVKWRSLDEGIVKVDENGVITAVGVGEACVIAESYDGKAFAEISVKVNPVEVTHIIGESFVVITVGEEFAMTNLVLPENATYKQLEYTSMDGNIAKVNANGVITAVNAGNTVITVKAANGVTRSVAVYVMPIEATNLEISDKALSLEAGKSVTLTVKVLPEGAVSDVKWYTDDESVVSVENGVVLAKNKGTATVFAQTENGIVAKCTVVVTKVDVMDIIFANASVSVKSGEYLDLKATVVPSIATDKQIKWSSSDKSIATVDENGVIIAKSVGKVIITAEADGVVKTIEITVTAGGNSQVLTWVLGGLFTLTAVALVACIVISKRKNGSIVE